MLTCSRAHFGEGSSTLCMYIPHTYREGSCSTLCITARRTAYPSHIEGGGQCLRVGGQRLGGVPRVAVLECLKGRGLPLAPEGVAATPPPPHTHSKWLQQEDVCCMTFCVYMRPTSMCDEHEHCLSVRRAAHTARRAPCRPRAGCDHHRHLEDPPGRTPSRPPATHTGTHARTHTLRTYTHIYIHGRKETYMVRVRATWDMPMQLVKWSLFTYWWRT